MRRRICAVKVDQIQEDAMINLTPLIDVVFVMLIMFIVVAPILELDQIELAKGHANTKEISSSIKDSSPVSIHVHKDNTIYFNHKQVSVQALRKELKEAIQQYPDVTPLLFHDKKALFGTYQEVKNAVEDAGFKDLNIVLNP